MTFRSIELRSEITAAGELRLSLDEREVGPAGPDEVVVRVDATPINPSDLNQLLGPADLATLERSGTPERPVVTATVPPHLVGMIASRADQSLTLGVEGAGVVVEAGANAQHLVGTVVSAAPGQMYTQYRKLQASEVFPFPDGVEEAAKHGITAVIQPGGSVKDDDVIAAADRLGLAMVFTGVRHFRH